MSVLEPGWWELLVQEPRETKVDWLLITGAGTGRGTDANTRILILFTNYYH